MRLSDILGPMPNRETKQAIEERAVFDAFLTTYPSFASTVTAIDQPDAQFPDVTVQLQNSGSIEFELTQWLHPDQVNQMKRRERLAEAMLDAIGDQGQNRSQHFGLVLLFPQPDFPRFAQGDGPRFRADVWALVEETERRWPGERFWNTPTGPHVWDFTAYPTLAKYVSQVSFDPLKSGEVWEEHFHGIPWIDVSVPCGSYSSDTALGALQASIENKVKAYGPSRQRPWLLVYYGSAVAYNTPWRGFKYRKFSDVAEEAARMVAGQSSFEKIFLLKALEPQLEAYEVFPLLTRCR